MTPPISSGSETYRADRRRDPAPINTPSPKIVDERGEVIGHVSYNGRVWPGATYVPDATPLYDNRAGLEP